MDLLATTVSSMAHSMKAMQTELKELQTDKINASWDHIQAKSNCNIVLPVLLTLFSPTRNGHGGFPASRQALAEEAVTLKTLRDENLQRRSGEQYNIKSLKTG